MKKYNKSRITILGGGIAGLSAGYFSKKAGLEFEIFEASSKSGGNCRTLNFGDFKVDTGAHRFHDKDEKMTREIMGLMGNTIKEINAPSYIFHHGKLIHFPLTPLSVFSQLSFSELCQAIWYFFIDKFLIIETNDFQSLAYKKYGRFMADMFLTNYSGKLWGEDCSELSLDIAGSRLKNLNFSSMLTEYLNKNSKSKHLEGTFFYPEKGFGAIADNLAEYCGEENIQKNNRITKITTVDKKIVEIEINNNKIIIPEIVINTLPVTLFTQMLTPTPPEEIMELVKKLKFRHLKLVIFLLDKDSVNNAATMYYPAEQFIFTRCYEPRNRSKKMSPPGKTSLVAEIPHSDNDFVSRLTDNEITEMVKRDLLSTLLIAENEISGTNVFSIPYAYPVLKKGYEQDYGKIIDYLNQFENLFITGRNGKFEYSWTHNMMRWGNDIIEKLKL